MTRALGMVRRTRRPAAAGKFYPGDSRELTRAVESLLVDAGAGEATASPGMLQGVVVPHAGYRYSGPFAAAAYALLRHRPVERVVLIGPAHFLPVGGCAVPAADTWLTPLGPVQVDDDARRVALDLPAVYADDAPHLPEHALEVQLPFLQVLFGASVRVLPVAVDAAPQLIADLLDVLVTGPGTLVIVSTDLSHYLPDELARQKDAGTARAIQLLDVAAIGDNDACGAHALRGLLSWARRSNRALEQIALGTSADTAGDPRRVVGYGAFATVSAPPSQSSRDRQTPGSSSRSSGKLPG